MNIYEEIGLKRIINANGRVTILGVSTINDDVANASKLGGQSYVLIDDLINKSGEIISKYTGAEDSCVTNSASAAICLTIAGLISKGKKSIIENLPNSSNLPNEIIIQKGHSINYNVPISTMIKLGGGIPIEVGTANEVASEDVEEAINKNTVAILYVKSHHCIQKGMLDINTMKNIAKKYNLPFIIDAAAEEDLKKYINLGADLVIYSGAKALEATTSGFVTGKKEYISYIKKQYKGIGRAMKIGKESIMGLLKALEIYEKKDKNKEQKNNLEKVNYLYDEINKINGLKAQKIQDEAGREIYRTRICIDKNYNKKTLYDINEELKSGNPSIYARTEFLNLGYIDFDPRPLKNDDTELIIKRLKEIMEN